MTSYNSNSNSNSNSVFISQETAAAQSHLQEALQTPPATLEEAIAQRNQAVAMLAQLNADTLNGAQRMEEAIAVLTLVRPCIAESVPDGAMQNETDFAEQLLIRTNRVIEGPLVEEAGGTLKEIARLPDPLLSLYADVTMGRIPETKIPDALEQTARKMRGG